MNAESALCAFLSEFLRVGGFHPEDDLYETGNQLPDGTWSRAFTDDEADVLDVSLTYLYCCTDIDPCAIALAAFPAHLPIPKWEPPC